MKKIQVEIWWLIEKLAGHLWGKFCPDDKVSYWLDWLPAWAYCKRKKAERRLYGG